MYLQDISIRVRQIYRLPILSADIGLSQIYWYALLPYSPISTDSKRSEKILRLVISNGVIM